MMPNFHPRDYGEALNVLHEIMLERVKMSEIIPVHLGAVREALIQAAATLIVAIERIDVIEKSASGVKGGAEVPHQGGS